MKRVLFLLLSVLLFTASSALAADVRKYAIECLEKSGTTQTIANLKGLLDAQLAQERASSPRPDRIDPVADIFARTFDVTAIHDTTLDRMVRDLTPADLADQLNWLNTSLGKRIAAAETSANDPANQALLQEFLQRLPADPPSRQREDLVQALVQNTDAVDYAVAIVSQIIEEVSTALIASLPELQRPDMTELKAQLKAQKPALRRVFGEEILAQYLFTYREFTDAEIARYNRHLIRPETQRFIKAVFTGFQDGLLQVFRNSASEIAKLAPTT